MHQQAAGQRQRDMAGEAAAHIACCRCYAPVTHTPWALADDVHERPCMVQPLATTTLLQAVCMLSPGVTL